MAGHGCMCGVVMRINGHTKNIFAVWTGPIEAENSTKK
jgi:hypothetical protein